MLERIYGIEDRYKFEVQLDQHNKDFNGVTYSYKTTVFYGKANCRGQVNAGTKKVMLEELKIVEVRMSQGGDACIMTLFLNYSKNGADEFMEGTYTSMNTRDSSSCGRGTVFLQKVNTSDFYKEPFLVKREQEALKKKSSPRAVATNSKPKPVIKTTPPVAKNSTPKKNSTSSPTKKTSVTSIPEKEVAVTKPSGITVSPARTDSIKQIEKKLTNTIPTPRVLANRQNELVKTITVNTTDVQIDIYDNGTIDNDTVSVYLDKKLIVSKARLTDQPITVRLKLDGDNDYHELVMVAENLGDIPPNTSLMVVKAGDKQYEVRITSTEQKNAVVIFKYEKPG
jgi:hypothetical protein